MFFGLYRTRTGDHHETAVPNVDASHVYNRALRLHLAAHQFERLCYGNHFLNAGCRRQRLKLVPPSATAHGGYDGSL